MLGVAGCVFEPVDLEGRACNADSDCISGYACSAAERVCVLVPDSGRPDAGRADAAAADVGRDANGDAFAPLDADLDAPTPLDAAETSEDAGPDAAASDADLDAALEDAPTSDAALEDALLADDAR
jgi:hypothetical protein